METHFPLNHELLAGDARYERFAEKLGRQTQIGSAAEFNRYCRETCRLWDLHVAPFLPAKPGPHFPELLRRVEAGGPEIIRTGWGGVVIERHEPPEVEKYLVVRKGGYLALEMHELKDERLEVREGAGVLLWRREGCRPLGVQALQPGQRFHFRPGVEHCIVATEDLLVFERSTDPKGMDQDLIFLYEPAPAE
jgi:hypothetical protein